MALLGWAKLVVATMPFSWWRGTLGGRQPIGAAGADTARALRCAAQVEWAGRRLPFPTKCLPRAMALSWTLRSKGIAHSVIFAVRPADLRGLSDPLHAWVEIDGDKILGDLPGPWVETLRLGDSPRSEN